MAGDFAAKIKAYAVPAVLFSFFMLYQLVLLPRAFPPTHYDGESQLCIYIRIFISILDLVAGIFGFKKYSDF